MTQTNKIHQVILLNSEGFVHYTSNSLFNADRYKKEVSIIKEFPFLESIFPSLLNMNPNDEPLRYSKMVDPIDFLKGAFDFSFKWLNTKEGSFILWTIYDYSQLYQSIRLSQQKRNELELYREGLEAKHGKIGSINDLD